MPWKKVIACSLYLRVLICKLLVGSCCLAYLSSDIGEQRAAVIAPE